MIKVIGIGNLLMGDDGIAHKVINSIEKEISELGLDIKCIKAETDFNFALDNIEEGDFIFILDSTLLGLECGQVTLIPLSEVDKYSNKSFSIHGISLISLIKDANLKINGIIIGIEVAEVKFNLELSNEVKNKFDEICKEVYEVIKDTSFQYVKKGESSA